MKMSKVQMLRVLVKQRETAAAEEILELFERTVGEYKGDCCSGEGGEPRLEQLDAELSTAVLSFRAEVQQVIIGEQVPCEPQDQGLSVDTEPSHIKEEVWELWSSQEGTHLQEPIPMNSKDKTQSSHLQSRKTGGEECAESERVRKLSMLVKHRLTSAVDEMLGLFEATLAEYEEEIQDLRKLLEEAVKTKVQVNTTDVAPLLVIKQEVETEQQDWRTSLEQGNPEPPCIKEEQLWSSRSRKKLQGLEEDDTKIFFIAECVKSVSAERKAQSPQIHQKQTGVGGEDCEGPAPASLFGPSSILRQKHDDKIYSSNYDTENNNDYSQESSKSVSDLVAVNYNKGSVSQKGSNAVEKQVDSIQKVSINTGQKPFCCSFCGKGFSEKSDLKRHVRFHRGEKPFDCSVCGKAFRDKKDLTRHVRVDTCERPFSCPICGKIFSQRENLHRHQRIHSGEKPHSCPVCTKLFVHRGAMVVHMRIHTGEKLFGCPVCGKRYIEEGNLKKHMRVHTGD